MDARAYRMNLPTDLTVFEIDYVVIQDYKTKVLKGTNKTISILFCISCIFIFR